jgi:3-methyladenine DNA glycosylase AlkD
MIRKASFNPYMNAEGIIEKIKLHANPKNIEGMARFGINPHKTLGVSIPVLRKTAKEIGKNHILALQLWDTGIHEAKILSSMIDDFQQVTSEQMDTWVKDFDSWDVCDQVCMNLFDKTEFVDKKIAAWSKSEKEFIKRAAFALIASLAVHDKKRKDAEFEKFFPLIIKHSSDERNFVRKAVNWALRQIGKRNSNLFKKAIICAEVIEKTGFRSAKWIAHDALRELRKRLITV